MKQVNRRLDMQLQISVLVNKEINELIDYLAKMMGTSKRNIISIALSDILNSYITKNKMNDLQEDIHGITHAINITVNAEFKNKVNQIDRFGLSRRKFFGLLVCDYFYQKYTGYLDKDVLNEGLTSYETNKVDIQITVDKAIKTKIIKYCAENAISLNSLIAHYVVNKPLIIKPFESTDKDFLHLNFRRGVKDQIEKNAIEINVSERYYLNLIIAQISFDLGL